MNSAMVDEFEEFRARSYSGGLAVPETFPKMNKSMVDLRLPVAHSEKRHSNVHSNDYLRSDGCYGAMLTSQPSGGSFDYSSVPQSDCTSLLHPMSYVQYQVPAALQMQQQDVAQQEVVQTQPQKAQHHRPRRELRRKQAVCHDDGIEMEEHTTSLHQHLLGNNKKISPPTAATKLLRPGRSMDSSPKVKVRQYQLYRHKTAEDSTENGPACSSPEMMRPRGYTMPQPPAICIDNVNEPHKASGNHNHHNHQHNPRQSSGEGKELSYIVRNFKLRNGKILEGAPVERQSSVASSMSVDSTGSAPSNGSTGSVDYYRVMMHGGFAVGKASIIRAFSKNNINDDDDDPDQTFDDEGDKMVSVLLDGEESALEFVDVSDEQSNSFLTSDQIDAYVIVYSVEDRKSFEGAIDRLYELRQDEDDRHKAVILVANKSDLVRTRVVMEEEGKSAAKNYDCKYIEVSAAIDHKVDELLVGIVKQIRLLRTRREASRHKLNLGQQCCPLKGQQNMLGRFLNNRLFSSKSCENLYVL